jgi:transcriptional regulator with XRE-family HTH domain
MTAQVINFPRMEGLPNRIREWRKKRGWTQQQLGERAGCSYVQVSDLERGAVGLTQHWMERFASALEISVADLLPASHNPDSLSPDERELVDRLRRAGDAQRRQLLDMAAILIPDEPVKRNGTDG